MLAAGLAFCGGCAERPQAAPTRIVYGWADLNALVRRQPGWAGLAQYDAALARLNAAARLPAAGRADPKMAILPALPLSAEPLNAGPSAAGPGDAGEISRNLSAVQASLTGGLEGRRKAARAEQIRRQQELWRRDARKLFPIPARTAEISSDLTLQLLEVNVETLTRTLDYWNDSPPPAPALARLKLTVEANRARLTALIAARIQARARARAGRLAAIRQQRQARLDYVSAQGDALAARLQADDARIVSAQTQRLSAQRMDLLAALARPEPVSIPAVGNSGALTLPAGPGAAQASLSAASVSAARTTLMAQRERWVQYLYDDTRASALDTAGRRRWNITFGPPRRGDRDMTADLERAMAKG